MVAVPKNASASTEDSAGHSLSLNMPLIRANAPARLAVMELHAPARSPVASRHQGADSPEGAAMKVRAERRMVRQ